MAAHKNVSQSHMSWRVHGQNGGSFVSLSGRHQPPQAAYWGKSGFTLVELLIVVAIIGILAAILFPTFARVRENARRTNCQSNLKQIGLAIMQYTQDYDELFPMAIVGNANDGSGWVDIIKPYIGGLSATDKQSVFQCYSDRTDPSGLKGTAGYTDYWINAALSWNGSTSSPSYKKGISVAALLNPSLTIMNGDGSGGSAHSRGSYRMNGCTNGGGPAPSYDDSIPYFSVCSSSGFITANGIGGSTIKHFDGHNLCFADGHVKWFKGIRATSSEIASTLIYDMSTGFNDSGNSPTFNAVGKVSF